jgi:AraC-like DNA-binding protein
VVIGLDTLSEPLVILGVMVDGADPPYVHVPGILPGVVADAVGYRHRSRTGTVHRGLPSPYLTFIFSLAGPVTGADDPDDVAGPAAFRHHVLLGGLDTRPAYIVQPTFQAGIQLAVHPLAARALFGAPAAEVAELAMDASDLLGTEAERVRQRIAGEGSWQAAFGHLASYLRSRVSHPVRDAPRPEVAEAWSWIIRHRGRGSVDDLARHVALSPRQLRTLFRQEVGLGPKAVNGLFRFHHATRRLAVTSGRPPGLADVAHVCGYADQAHLARDFRRYTGTSPSGWLAEERRNIQAGGYSDPAGLTT